ncbi:MAG TPA: CPBP family intramembrane glutamic endopeptidase [Caulobacteraceae bacterium]|nr:CPBP family intramembrane glutamic endopeptidase [Caulobacteraceae bacterium]
METGATELKRGNRFVLAPLCLLAGVLPLAARWTPNESVAVAYGLVVAAALGAVALYLGRRPERSGLRGLFLAFFVFAVVQVLNNVVPKLILADVLHETPTPGNPLASSLVGSIVIQLAETAIALVPILLLTLAPGETAAGMYLQKGRVGFWLAAALVFFAALYLLTLRVAARHVFPLHGAMPVGRFLSLSPALLLMVLTNGLQEELLFRALFLRKLISELGFWTANIVQAMVFTVAHVGISYTPNALLFMVLFVAPLGLFGGFLMRRTDSVIAPTIFHAAADLPIYLSFLSFVA